MAKGFRTPKSPAGVEACKSNNPYVPQLTYVIKERATMRLGWLAPTLLLYQLSYPSVYGGGGTRTPDQ